MPRPIKPRAGQAILPTMAALAKKPSDTPGYKRRQPEARIVSTITRDLTNLGYSVARVGQGIARGSGTTVGFPDLPIRRIGWPRAIVCPLEVKTANGRLSPEQQALHDAGWSYVVRSSWDALRALYITECALGELEAAQKLADALRQAGEEVREG